MSNTLEPKYQLINRAQIHFSENDIHKAILEFSNLFNERITNNANIRKERLIRIILLLRSKVIELMQSSNMKEKYPADTPHFLYDVMLLTIDIINSRGEDISEAELISMLIGAILHDIERYDKNIMTKRKEGESYDQYKMRHQRKCVTVGFKHIINPMGINGMLTKEEKSLIAQIIGGHDIIPSEFRGNGKRNLCYNRFIEIVSLADKLSFYLPHFISEYLNSHSDNEAIEKMLTMYLELNERDRLIVDSIDKGIYSGLYKSAKDLIST